MSIPHEDIKHAFEELQAATWDQLIQWGIIIPARDKFDPELWEPLPNPKGIDLLAEFLKEREEERY